MRKFIFLIILAISSLKGLAQKDYLIKQSNDTLWGRSLSLTANKVRFQTENGTLRISDSEIKEFSFKKRKYLIIQNPFVDELVKCRVLADGPVKFLHDDQSVLTNVECLDYVLIHQSIYPVNRRYLSEEIWSILMKCNAFSGNYSNEKKDGVLILNKKQRRIWTEMIRFYNSTCS